jgi:transcription termination factor Rho
MASSNDCDIKSHTRIAQLAIERAKRLVEAGKHCVHSAGLDHAHSSRI